MTYEASDQPDPNLPPGFRVYPDELSNEHALRLMSDACNMMTRTALEVRRTLLSAGFATDHTLCKELDGDAREYATRFEVVRRQMIADRQEQE